MGVGLAPAFHVDSHSLLAAESALVHDAHSLVLLQGHLQILTDLLGYLFGQLLLQVGLDDVLELLVKLSRLLLLDQVADLALDVGGAL